MWMVEIEGKERERAGKKWRTEASFMIGPECWSSHYVCIQSSSIERDGESPRSGIALPIRNVAIWSRPECIWYYLRKSDTKLQATAGAADTQMTRHSPSMKTQDDRKMGEATDEGEQREAGPSCSGNTIATSNRRG